MKETLTQALSKKTFKWPIRIRKIQIKTPMIYHFIPIIIPNDSENRLEVELLYIANGNVHWFNYFGKVFCRSAKAKYICIL